MARVLVITPSYSPRLGGVEKHVWFTSRLLRRAGWDVTILTERFGDLPEYEERDGLPIVRLNYPRRRFWGLMVIWRNLLLKYARLVREADIIHIHDVFIWYLPLRLLFWRKKIVTTFHGWEGVYPVPWKNVLIRRVSAWLSDRTVAVGKYVEKYYRFRADKVIYGAVEMPRGKSVKENLLLYVGRLDYNTGLPVLLQALKAGSWRGKVIFCGDGLLREQAEQLGEVRGFSDPRPFLKKATVVFAGGYLSILEAFAFRAVVVAAGKNALEKNYYLMTPFAAWVQLVSTPVELTRALARPARQTNSGVRQASAWVATQTWQAVVDTYLQLYRELYK